MLAHAAPIREMIRVRIKNATILEESDVLLPEIIKAKTTQIPNRLAVLALNPFVLPRSPIRIETAAQIIRLNADPTRKKLLALIPSTSPMTEKMLINISS